MTERWAKMPESILRLGCAHCVALFGLLDLEQGDRGRPFRGTRSLAERTGWSRNTVRKHVAHLVTAGYVKADRDGRHKDEFPVLNPCRGGSRTDPQSGEVVVTGSGSRTDPAVGQNLRENGSRTDPLPSSLLWRSLASDSAALVASNDAASEGLSQRAARATADSPTIGAFRRRNGAA